MDRFDKARLFFRKQELISANEKTIEHLETSEDSIWSSLTARETKEILEIELRKLENDQEFNKFELAVLFAPTGNIQEISMYNGWSKEYMEIALTIDKFTENS